MAISLRRRVGRPAWRYLATMTGMHRVNGHHNHGHRNHHQHGPHGHRDHHGHHDHHAARDLNDDHERAPRILLAPHASSRRAFLGNLGKGTMAMAVFSPAVLAACSGGSQPLATSAEAEPQAEPQVEPEETTGALNADVDAVAENEAGTSDLVWARAQLGFVSAYVLARGNSAAIVDTGVAGSAEAIGATLGELGLNYGDVDHVLLTHHHSDHTGSIGEVLEMAVNATAYAGEADVPSIAANVTGLAGGEDIFGLEMVPTPGHTLGHMAAIDHQAGLFIAGDAIFTEGGAAVEGPERFFMSVAESRRSIAAVAALSFNTLLVGHGDPIEGGADAAVAALAATFG